MRVVDHHDRAVFFGGFGQTGQRSDIAVHREDAVGDQQLPAGRSGKLRKDSLGGGDVFVGVHVDLRAREAAAIDDARVIQLVGNDVVVGSEDRGDGTGVGGESGLEHDAGFHIFELGDTLFKLH